MSEQRASLCDERRSVDVVSKWRCRLGFHTADRSQGLVGYCLRGCGDLRAVHNAGHTWVRYVELPSEERGGQPDGVHTIPVPRGWAPEQAWEAIKRGDLLTDPEPGWTNVIVENGRYSGVVL